MKGIYIGLGSNLSDPIAQIDSAITALDAINNISVVISSSRYASPPMGPQDQPDYINAVVEVETSLSPHELLDKLQQIEQEQGRIRLRHWGERTIDLDLLVYANETLADERLTVPHPGVASREFVLYPLAEIAPNLSIPTLASMEILLQQCPINQLKRLS
ncbi:MAG: 2-amino-4-hydroxy-6-hydroxymethyldihydropteridine diphosphokinase [Gammaproteobacteria bacterium]|nr:MAG: 2-amino-4-hydroxy-6-hydroxymethyldihydropteridine diphosphokinase [Gammaproteobacteria bacterium]